MEIDLYRQLQIHLDNHPVPFPATDTGTDIKLLKSLFTEEEARIALQLGALLERPSKIHRRLAESITIDDLKLKLYSMFQKGIIRGVKDRNNDGEFLFSKMPLAIGMFEAQVDKITKESAELFFDYEKEGFAEAVIGKKTNQMRTIPLNIKIDPEYHVSNYDDIANIIKNSPGPFAVMNCVCRQAKDAMDKSCQKTEHRETCILLESGVDFALNMRVGRTIDKAEVLQLITRAKKTGLVLQPENNQHPHFICCCCGCCCGVLTAAKHYDQQAKKLHSNYFASVSYDQCSQCLKCIDRCPMDAIDETIEGVKVNLDRCIGCGACVPTCREKAMKLVKKDEVIIPPKTDMDMYKNIMIERFGWTGAAKFVIKSKLGMKV